MKKPDLVLRRPMPPAAAYSDTVMALADAARADGMGWVELSFEPPTNELVLRGWYERPADYGSLP